MNVRACSWIAAVILASLMSASAVQSQIPPIPTCSTGKQCGVPSGNNGDCVSKDCNACTLSQCTALRKVADTVPVNTVQPYRCCSELVEMVCYESYSCSSAGNTCTTGEQCGTAWNPESMSTEHRWGWHITTASCSGQTGAE